jgi:hypothetical protein
MIALNDTIIQFLKNEYIKKEIKQIGKTMMEYLFWEMYLYFGFLFIFVFCTFLINLWMCYYSIYKLN